ncbi:hypothetical protein WDW89_21575 [Deltaproteobacteria bacterium TL4]
MTKSLSFSKKWRCFYNGLTRGFHNFEKTENIYNLSVALRLNGYNSSQKPKGIELLHIANQRYQRYVLVISPGSGTGKLVKR